jgi:light-regulated signal transduction histidine kinase (bacteriophytochrome)
MNATVIQAQPGAVDLANCADEPIHIPGLIQPHGALLVFDRAARLTAWSDNAAAMLGLATPPALELSPADLGLPAAVQEQIADSIADMCDGASMPVALEAELDGGRFDCIVHAHQERLLAEFELRELSSDAVAAFALKAHAAIDRLKRQRDIPALLQLAVESVRNITGFDRVMAYRFRQDDSGDVVAEALNNSGDAPLTPFIDRRYPASDIPAQARRLYIINTLRLIADVGYAPVALHGAPGAAPLDMSYSVLRSVSPIHVEYLQNMGVGASMSVSIVVNDHLWGLIACHHMGPKQVPYSIRMAIDVLAQVLASTVQSLEARGHAALSDLAAQVRTRVMETLLHEDDPLQALAQHAPALCDSLNAGALLIAHHGKRLTHGEVDTDAGVAIVAALEGNGGELVEFNRRSDWPHAAQPLLGRWAGALALHFDPANGGWLVALRPEQVEAVAWAGKPEKVYASGPLGPRLTPRGSFDEWREIVRGSAEPWEPVYRTIAGQLLSEMHRASVARQAETDRTRTQLLAMLGHDLRDPLHSINMAAIVLEHAQGQGQQNTGQTLGRRIQASSHRMQRLIAQVLDLSRIQGGMGLGLMPASTDVAALVTDIVDESRMAHPGVVYELRVPATLTAMLDGDRIAQVLTNLLGNARHHGAPGQPVRIALDAADGRLRIVVSNVAEPIAEPIASTLFNPFKRSSLHNERNRSGMGLGLYIAREIVLAHGGEIDYRAEPPLVLFSVELPWTAPPGAAR